MNPLQIVASLARIAIDIANGTHSTVQDVVRALLGAGLDLLPVEELRQHLDAEAAARAELAADAAELAKFGR